MMKQRIRIGNKIVGAGRPCFVIAEAGINHNGSLRMAERLISRAAAAGADAIKFQTFKAEDVVTPSAGLAAYQKRSACRVRSQRALLEKYELPYDAFSKLRHFADKKKILFLSTPHSSGAVTFLRTLVPAYKVSSADLTNELLLRQVASTGKPVILSTGMATMTEIKAAVSCVRSRRNNNLILLHCTTRYPCPPREVNLRAMAAIGNATGCPIGYSDHTLGLEVPLMAVALGAVIIEKHFTLDRSLPGPDHKASMEPDEFTALVSAIRRGEQALGAAEKAPTKSEKEIMRVCRKSLVAAEDIPAGTRITAEMLCAKRPGTGISPFSLAAVLGARAAAGIKKDDLIQWQMIVPRKGVKSHGRR